MQQLIKLLFISVLVLFSNYSLGATVMPLGSYADTLVTVDVALSNTLIAEFVVDTGASHLVIGAETFRASGELPHATPKQAFKANTASGERIVLFLYEVPTIRLSGCTLHNVEVAVNMNDNINVLGWSVLKHIQPFTIDSDAMTLTGENCGG